MKQSGPKEAEAQRLSVAMCVYNGAAFVREQLDSLASQSRLPDELVVCDDRSVDRTPQIIEAFASEAAFPVRFIVNEENLGYTKNLEKAITLSSGDIIALSDQDDVWHPEKLGLAETILSNSPRIGAVFSNAEIADEHLNPLGYSLWQSADFNRRRQKRFARGEAFEVILRSNVVYGTTMTFRAAFKELVLPIPRTWYADEWIALLISAASDLYAVHEPLVKYRQHSKNVFGARRKETFTERLVKARQSDQVTSYLANIDKYMLVRRRLLEVAVPSHDKNILELEDKIKHLQARVKMEAGIPRRLPSVFRELATLRYHRHSDGWKSAAKDLLF